MERENYAIDIALIPEKKVMDLSIGLNKQLCEKAGDYSMVLGESECLPHISLAMCGIHANRLDKLKSAVFEKLRGFIPYKAEFSGYAVIETSGGDTVSGIDIIKDETILGIQDILVEVLDDFRCEKITPDFFSGNGIDISDFSLDYSENYLKNQTGDNFSPHITLGHGNIKEVSVYEDCPEFFTCNRLAICHLGNHCTCAGILGSIEII
ncbi:MAG: hypothetical protein JW931_00470 [Methanomicrobiaceae archaeon]|nr:hypothetical protein [Methanomicrobiaceae archaeon]